MSSPTRRSSARLQKEQEEEKEEWKERKQKSNKKSKYKQESEEEDADSEVEESDEFVPSSEEETPASSSLKRRRSGRTTRSSVAARAASSSSSSRVEPAPKKRRQSPRRRRGVKWVEQGCEDDEDEEMEGSDDENEAKEEDDGVDEDASSSDDEEGQCASLKKVAARSKDKMKENKKQKIDHSKTRVEWIPSSSSSAACSSSSASFPRTKRLSKHSPENERVNQLAMEGSSSLASRFHALQNGTPFDPPDDSQWEEVLQQVVRGRGNVGASSSAAPAAAASCSSTRMQIDAGEPAAAAADSLVDFTPRLPLSLSQHVFTFLAPTTVAGCERVSKGWHSLMSSGSHAVYKQLFGVYFPKLRAIKAAQLRQHSASDAHELAQATLALRQAEVEFFNQPNPEGMTSWAARRTDGKAVPVYNPHANAPLGTVQPREPTLEERLQPKQGTFHWKHSLINRLFASCVECRSLTLDVYKLTGAGASIPPPSSPSTPLSPRHASSFGTRVCMSCAMRHPLSKYDVLNSGCAKGKFLLLDRELELLPHVIEFDPTDDHKTIFFMRKQVEALRNVKYGGEDAFQRVWAERVQAAEERLAQRREQQLTSKKLIPKVYREGVGSTPEKTKGFFLCGRHNLATLFHRITPPRSELSTPQGGRAAADLTGQRERKKLGRNSFPRLTCWHLSGRFLLSAPIPQPRWSR